MNLRRDFLLFATLAATAATPALAQDAARAVGPASSGTQGAASIPDFSGIWSHPSFPGFEPPTSGPGPVVNTMRRPQVTAADGRILPPGNSVLVSNPALLVGDVHQSDLEALGGGSREAAQRDGVKRRGLSDPDHPVLARTRSLHFQRRCDADAPAAGQDHSSSTSTIIKSAMCA